MKRPIVTVLLGFLILSSLQGISTGQEGRSLKEKEMPNKEKHDSKIITLIPPIDASRPDKMETATFALG